jgi:hypothetical protein
LTKEPKVEFDPLLPETLVITAAPPPPTVIVYEVPGVTDKDDPAK